MLASASASRALGRGLAARGFVALIRPAICAAQSKLPVQQQFVTRTQIPFGMATPFSTQTAKASSAPIQASTADYDPEIKDIADYIHNYKIDSELALDTSRYILLDTLGCGLEALRFKECTKILGPIVEGTVVPNGTKVPGTPYQLDPVNGAFNIGAMIRWLDYNDCWLAAEWGHPSDNLGGILAVADWLSRTNKANGKEGIKMNEVLTGMIQAHEVDSP